MREQCVHIERGELEHLHTVDLTTVVANVQDDYRYVTGPDSMKLCALCTGRLIGYLSRSEFSGGLT
jgi:hypothetical protein